MMVGEKVKRRLQAVPENLKAAMNDLRTESAATAVSNMPVRFGKANRELVRR